MSRAIDGDALKDYFQSLAYDDWNQGVTTSWADAYSECADIVEDTPTIVPERKQGRWIQTRHFGRMYRMCSSCSAERKDDLSTGWNYCPYCGADMRGEQNEAD